MYNYVAIWILRVAYAKLLICHNIDYQLLLTNKISNCLFKSNINYEPWFNIGCFEIIKIILISKNYIRNEVICAT